MVIIFTSRCAKQKVSCLIIKMHVHLLIFLFTTFHPYIRHVLLLLHWSLYFDFSVVHSHCYSCFHSSSTCLETLIILFSPVSLSLCLEGNSFKLLCLPFCALPVIVFCIPNKFLQPLFIVLDCLLGLGHIVQ